MVESASMTKGGGVRQCHFPCILAISPSWFLGSGSWEVEYKDKDSVGVEEGVDDPDKGDGGWSRSNSWWSCKQTRGGQTFELFGLWKSSIIGGK